MTNPAPARVPATSRPSLGWDTLLEASHRKHSVARISADHRISARVVRNLLAEHGFASLADLRAETRARLVTAATTPEGRIDLSRLDADQAALADRFVTTGILTATECLEMAAAWQQGVPTSQIATRHGRNADHESIRGLLQRALGLDLPVRPRGPRRILDPATEASVVQAYQGGTNAVALAEVHGVDEATIRRCLERHDVPRRPRGSHPRPHPDRVAGMIAGLDLTAQAALAAAYRDGATYRTLRATYRVGDPTIARILRHHGVTPRPRGAHGKNQQDQQDQQGQIAGLGLDEQRALVAAYLDDGVRVADLAVRFAVSRDSVRRVLRRHAVLAPETPGTRTITGTAERASA